MISTRGGLPRGDWHLLEGASVTVGAPSSGHLPTVLSLLLLGWRSVLVRRPRLLVHHGTKVVEAAREIRAAAKKENPAFAELAGR